MVGRHLRRLTTLVLGWFLIGLGVIGLFVPVLQGVLLILLGLYVLSRELHWARRLLNRVRDRYPALERQIQRLRERFRFLHFK